MRLKFNKVFVVGDTVQMVYPTCCTSAFCGNINCDGCKYRPILDEFKAWVSESGAKRMDPVWSPTVYSAHWYNK